METSHADVPNFFDRLVLISNSVPKSGSTFLFTMQQSFLLSLAGKKAADFTAFAAAGVPVDHGYLAKPHAREFLDLIADKTLTGGPYVIKTHTLLNAELREVIVGSDNVFASTAIRDPLEIYFSARDNFRKTGEFPEFSTVERGCDTVSGYFAKIFQAAVNTSYAKTVPIVRYGQIMADPVGALLASLHGTIKDHALRKVAGDYLDLGKAAAGASNRLNLGTADRRSHDGNDADFDAVFRALAGARQAFGYGPN